MSVNENEITRSRALQRYYPWVVIGIAFLTVAVAFGTRNAFAVFLVAVIEEFHWSRALVSGAPALFIGAGAEIGPWVGDFIYDLTGGYFWAFCVAQSMTSASVGFI